MKKLGIALSTCTAALALGAFALGVRAQHAPAATAAAESAASSCCQPGGHPEKRQQQPEAPVAQTWRVVLTDQGYEPASISVKRGIPARVTFVRKTEGGCGAEVVLPDFKIREPLPLNKEVSVSFTPQKAGTFSFTCGMGMLRGKLVVK